MELFARVNPWAELCIEKSTNLMIHFNQKSIHWFLKEHFYRPQRSCFQGYVFTRVCDSVNRGVSASVHAGSRHPPVADTPSPKRQTPRLEADPPRSRHPSPQKQTPPRSRHPLPGSRHPPRSRHPHPPGSRHPPETDPQKQTPPEADTPLEVDTPRSRQAPGGRHPPGNTHPPPPRADL